MAGHSPICFAFLRQKHSAHETLKMQGLFTFWVPLMQNWKTIKLFSLFNHWLSIRLFGKHASWIRTEDEIFCYSNKKQPPVVSRTEITLKKTVFSPKCVRITPSKMGTPRKQMKRNLLNKSAKELSRHSIKMIKKTPSKSPYTKKARKCLEDELFDNHDIETTSWIIIRSIVWPRW